MKVDWGGWAGGWMATSSPQPTLLGMKLIGVGWGLDDAVHPPAYPPTTHPPLAHLAVQQRVDELGVLRQRAGQDTVDDLWQKWGKQQEVPGWSGCIW